MTRELYQEMNGFREDFIVCEDYELWLRVTHKYEVGFIEEPILNKYGGHDDDQKDDKDTRGQYFSKSIQNFGSVGGKNKNQHKVDKAGK